MIEGETKSVSCELKLPLRSCQASSKIDRNQRTKSLSLHEHLERSVDLDSTSSTEHGLDIV